MNVANRLLIVLLRCVFFGKRFIINTNAPNSTRCTLRDMDVLPCDTLFETLLLISNIFSKI